MIAAVHDGSVTAGPVTKASSRLRNFGWMRNPMTQQGESMKFGASIAALALAAGAWTLPAQAVDITGAGRDLSLPHLRQVGRRVQEESPARHELPVHRSGGGIKQITAKTVDFGASDMPMKPEDLEKNGLGAVPGVMGGVVPVVKIEGVPRASSSSPGSSSPTSTWARSRSGMTRRSRSSTAA
jgi:phosphate transport system substrate-binding protein